uniref:Equilibrative nucleoside transporter 1 n=1 Tax=Caenorhabditis japonica TaxID=281687 RepID=A0A8R1DI57_CAEJA
MVSANRLENYEVEQEEQAPRDKFNIVYYLVILVGFGVLLPWNMFITIAPEYYVNYWFKPSGKETWFSKEFMGALTIASQLPNVSINVFNLFLIIAGPLIYRVFAPVCFNIINLTIILILAIVLEPSESLMTGFFWVTLGMATSINFSNGLYENSVYGVFADFPHIYIGALLIGNNICGLLITLVKIGVTLIMNDNPRLVAIVYFCISLAILVVCAIALLFITKQNFYHYYHQKGIEVREKAETEKPSPSILWQTFKSCYGQLFNVWFCFAVTLTIFPVMTTATTRGKHGFLDRVLPENKELYTLLTSFLVFNLFATIGSIIASKIHWPTPKYLKFAIVGRAILIPIFFFCNYRADDRIFPVFFESTDVFVFAGIVMSLSHGYLSALAMGYTPSEAPSHYSRFAAQLSVCTLMVGLLTGGLWAVVIENLVDRPDQI